MSDTAELTLSYENDSNETVVIKGRVKDVHLRHVLKDKPYDDGYGKTYFLEFVPVDDEKLVDITRIPKFTEIRTTQVVVPRLTPENIALAAAQAGVESTEVFSVVEESNHFVLTFTEYFVRSENE